MKFKVKNAEALQTLYKHHNNLENHGNDAKNKWDCSLVFRVWKEFDDVASVGKLFHVRATVMGNAQSPTVDCRVDRTSTHPDLSHHRVKTKDSFPLSSWAGTKIVSMTNFQRQTITKQ